jgi:hypothetical protein
MLLSPPRELGGWGLPHIISWLIQETPDTFASYITNRSTFYSLRPQEIAKQKMRFNLKRTVTEDFQRVGIKTLHPSPRCVHAVECQIQLVLSWVGLRLGRDKNVRVSKVFRDAAEAGMTQEIKEKLTLIIQSITMDATISWANASMTFAHQPQLTINW